MGTDEWSKEKYLFKFDEASEALEICFTAAHESDRGAVLICASLVDDYMRRLFENVGKHRVPSGRLKNMINYPGVLSSLSAKADIALLTGLIGKGTYEAIGILRSIRNKVAHSPVDFALADHEVNLRKLYDLGTGIGQSVNMTAMQSFLELIVQRFLDNPKLQELYQPQGGLSREEVIRRLSESPDTLSRLNKNAARFELGLAVAMLCAIIVWSWKIAESRVKHEA